MTLTSQCLGVKIFWSLSTCRSSHWARLITGSEELTQKKNSHRRCIALDWDRVLAYSAASEIMSSLASTSNNRKVLFGSHNALSIPDVDPHFVYSQSWVSNFVTLKMVVWPIFSAEFYVEINIFGVYGKILKGIRQPSIPSSHSTEIKFGNYLLSPRPIFNLLPISLATTLSDLNHENHFLTLKIQSETHPIN